MQYNIAVIGGGPGGYVAAIYAARSKAKVALIEKDEIGGTCLNKGCIPTKALIQSAHIYDLIKKAKRFGVNAENVNINWEAMQQNKNTIVANLTKSVETLLKVNGVDIYKGKAKLIDSNTINIISEVGEKSIRAEIIILATGSYPATIPIPGHDLEGVITSDEALSLPEVPQSMLIVGGGVIGIEIGYIYKTLGTEVTIVEIMPQILPRHDEEIARDLREVLQNIGIRIYTDAKIKSIEKISNHLKTTYETKQGIESVTTQKVLMSVGRKPVIDAFEALNLQMQPTGIVVDNYLRTSINNIYAIGDVTGKSMLAHVASQQGIVAAQNALGENKKMVYSVIPSCIYSHPEVASVGLTEQQAREKYKGKIKISKFPFTANGKAMTLGEIDGYVKMICDKRYNEILGVHIIGPHATELIAEAALAIKLECTAEELAGTIHAHPTLSETMIEASFDLLGKAIHKI
jgi:dihydrolipoamide dehydrogenase